MRGTGGIIGGTDGIKGVGGTTANDGVGPDKGGVEHGEGTRGSNGVGE